jgi:hypothetical protein
MKAQRLPTSEAWVRLPRELLTSDAWRALGINERRFVDFLMIEHMRHGGKANGSLLAPRGQLEQFGIGARYISSAIEKTERLGLVDCKRGTGRRPSSYALTWLPLSDGRAPSNRWRTPITSEGKSLPMTSQGKCLGYPKESHKARSDFRREVTKPKNKGIRREASSKKASYHEDDSSKLNVGGGRGWAVEGDVVRQAFAPGRPNPGKTDVEVRLRWTLITVPVCASG